MADEPAWLTKARSYIGFHEQAGNRGLQEFIDLAHVGEEGDPWCAIFANACIASAGYATSGSALARSFETSPNFVKLAKPVIGAIVTMWRGSKSAGTGHVTFFTGEQSGKLLGLGGNQSDQVCIEPFPEPGNITGYWWPAKAPPADGVAAPAPRPAGTVFSGITATVFGGPGDEQPVAYPDVAAGWDQRLGVALPFRYSGPRPSVDLQYQDGAWLLNVPTVDVGPWNVNDDWIHAGTRPEAESGTDASGRKTNLAGIDLTPETARQLGVPGKGIVNVRLSGSVQPAPKPSPVATPAPAQGIDWAPIIQEGIKIGVPLLERILLPGGKPSPAIEGIAAGIARHLPELALTFGAAPVLTAQGLGLIGPAMGASATQAGVLSTVAWALPMALGLLSRFAPQKGQ